MLRSGLRWRVALAAGIVACAGLGDFAQAAAVLGAPAPALVVKELGGQTFDLSALRGKVVVLNFWATWCPACREEMPALDAFYRRYRDQGVEVVGLSTDKSRKRSAVAEAMRPYSYPAAMLEDATSDGFGTPAALPETFVIDRDSIIRARLKSDQAGLTENSLATVVVPLLAQRREAPKPSDRDPVASP